jgi:transaldolase/glucose-6-phosphate isomerase
VGALAEAGASPQRLLWASTGTKSPALPDTLYVEKLIGPGTINTMPPSTLDAFRDHGEVKATLTEGIDESRDVLEATERLGLDLPGVTDGLEKEGLLLFSESFDQLISAVAAKRARFLGATPMLTPIA